MERIPHPQDEEQIVEVVGADGTKGGWIAVRLTDGRYEEARFFPEFDALLRAFSTATAITVDIPIGLPVRGRRQADLEAKSVLESLRNSVFFVPPRPALEAPTFEEAVRIARSLGSSMSLQIYGLRHKIFEVDGLASDRRIVEVHPEVSFWALNKSSALKHKKKSWNGLMMRLELLRKAGVELPAMVDGTGDAPADDIIDAAAAAWSALRVARGQGGSLPDSPDTDPNGRPVAIWY